MPFAILPGNNLYNSLLFHCKYLFEFAMEFVISHKTKVAQMSPDMKITQVKSNGKSLKNIELSRCDDCDKIRRTSQGGE